MAKAKLTRVWVVPFSLLAIVFVLALSQYRGNNISGQRANLSPDGATPGQVRSLTDPEAHRQAPGQADRETAAPRLQRGVKASDARVFLEVGTDPSIPAFDTNVLDAPADTPVALTFRNMAAPETNSMHSWVLVQPGTETAVAASAENAGPEGHFLPQSQGVLASTNQLAPGHSQTIFFRTPAQPGDYPFICTYPGHAHAMQGILHVVAKDASDTQPIQSGESSSDADSNEK